MALVITCPSCESKLKLPDSLAGSGKILKCPKCQGTVSIGAASSPTSNGRESLDEPNRNAERPASDRTPSKRRHADEDEEEAPRPRAKARVDDDDDDDRPAKRRRNDDDDDEEAPRPRAKARVDDDDDDRPAKRRRNDDDDEEEDKAPRKKARAMDDDDDDEVKPKKRRRDDDDDDDDGEDRAPSKRAKADLKESDLFAESSLLLRRKERIFFKRCFPYRCEFFLESDKQMIGVVEEKCNRWLKMFFGGVPILGKFMNIDLEVRDGDAKPVLFVVRLPGFRIKLNQLTYLIFGLKERRVEIVDADGELVCAFVMKMFSLTPSFHVYDAHDEKIGDFNFKTFDMKKKLPARMILQSPDGEPWGYVTGEEEVKMMKKLEENGGKAYGSVKFMPKKPGLFIFADPEAVDQEMAKKMLMGAAVALRLVGAHDIFEQK